MKLFSSKSQTFGLGQTNWADKFWGIWDVFGRFISTHVGTVSPLSMFSINFEIAPCGSHFLLIHFTSIDRKKIINSVTKMTIFPHGGKAEIFLFAKYVTQDFPFNGENVGLIHLLEQKHFPNSNLRVKTMYESVK